MSRRSVSIVTGAVPLAILLLTAPQVLAGDRVHGARQPITQSHPASAPVVRPVLSPVTISVAVTGAPAPAASETPYISLRGPDGRLRSFPVEGGADEMQSRIVVLRPGESLTIRFAAKK